MSMTCVRIDFELRMTSAEYHFLCQRFAEAVAATEGLHWKMWLIDERRGTAGGVYLFADRRAADAYLAGPVVAALGEAPQIANVTVDVSDVQEDLSALTGLAEAR